MEAFRKAASKASEKIQFQYFSCQGFQCTSKRVYRCCAPIKGQSLIDELTAAVGKLTQGVTIALSRERYEKEYRSEPIPKKLHLDSQYGVCFRTCIGHLLQLMADRGNRDRINIVLEGGHPSLNDCIRIFQDVKTSANRIGTDVLGTCTIANKKDCMPLMVADFLASAHSKLRAREANGSLYRTPFVLPKGQPAPKGWIAVLDLAPNG